MDQVKSLLNTAITNQNTILRRLDSEIFPTSSAFKNPFSDLLSSNSTTNSIEKRKANDSLKSTSDTSSPPPALEVNSFDSKKRKVFEMNTSVMPKLRVAHIENMDLMNGNEDEDEQGIISVALRVNF